MKKIKLTFPYPQWPILRQFPQSNPCWGNYEFFINPPVGREIDFDYWFVFNFPEAEYEETTCRKNGLVLITGEPDTVEPYASAYVGQFNYVITSQRKLKHKNKFYFPQGLPWFVNKTFDELLAMEEIPKTKMLSVISSSKAITDGHKKRLDFVLKLKSYFGDDIDLFGRGLKDFKDKWEVLQPYRYSIAIENTFQEDYFTEKISDCYLAHTLPVYYGCPNISKYFNPESLLKIDILDFPGTLKKIEMLLNSPDYYTQVLPLIKESKRKVLFEHNLFPAIIHFIERHMDDASADSFATYRVNGLSKQETLLKRIKQFF